MKGEVKEIQDTFPLPVEGCPGVFHCGFHDEQSFGAASYLLTRPEGNILVDIPRYNPILVRKLRAMGGFKWIFLSHRDDVGHHDKWAAEFGATRIIHKTEANAQQRTDACEVQLTGEGPWDVDGSSDLEIIHTPGHTAGSITLYHKPTKSMFTGDHLFYSSENEHLGISTKYVQSIPQQVVSLQKMLDYDFLHILPGHCRRFSFRDATERLKAITAIVERHS